MTLIDLSMKGGEASQLYLNSEYIIAIYAIDGNTRIVTTATNGNGTSLTYIVTQPVDDVVSKVLAAEAVARERNMRARSNGVLE